MHFKAENLQIPKHLRLLFLAQNLGVLQPSKTRCNFLWDTLYISFLKWYYLDTFIINVIILILPWYLHHQCNHLDDASFQVAICLQIQFTEQTTKNNNTLNLRNVSKISSLILRNLNSDGIVCLDIHAFSLLVNVIVVQYLTTIYKFISMVVFS